MGFYLDHNATTPVCNEALDAMEAALGYHWGNPSSLHAMGRQARSVVELARKTIANLIGAKANEIVFTSGGTEANNAALYGARWAEYSSMRVVRVSAVEHKSILQAQKWVLINQGDTLIPVDHDGLVLPAAVGNSIRRVGFPGLVSIMHANNETGVIQPIEEIADMIQGRAHWLLHVDACQSFGKIPVNVDNMGVDMMTISAHKVGGPKGVGALYVRDGVNFDPLIVGGHQEGNRRAGTENVAGVAGFAAAAAARCLALTKYQQFTGTHVSNLAHLIKEGLGRIEINGGAAPRVPNTLNVRFAGVQSEALILMLSERGIHVSNGSACESGSVGGSHVLKAMGQTEDEAQSAIRFSFGMELEEDAIKFVAENVVECVKSLRSMG